MRAEQDAIRYIIAKGEDRGDRTGAGTTSVFGDISLSFDLREGFPLLTTKKVSFRNVLLELLWFLSGDTRVSSLVRNGVNIWVADWRRHVKKTRGASDEECDRLLEVMRRMPKTDGVGVPGWDSNLLLAQDNLTDVYGKQWRNFGTTPGEGVDQISQLLEGLVSDPYGRRHIVSSWNPVDLPGMALPPCHTMFQFYVHTDGGLSCKMYQRSADFFLGVPYNIASYALLTHLVARNVGLEPRKLFITFGDAHLYRTHLDAARELLEREPLQLPRLSFAEGAPQSLFLIGGNDVTVEGYDPHPPIKAPLEVGS